MTEDHRTRIEVAVLYNVDFEEIASHADPGHAARADVAAVARAVFAALDDGVHRPTLVPVDADLVSLRKRLVELDPRCAFNLCESISGDARLESAVPLLLELMGVPYTGSPPEALATALYKDRVKSALETAGVPTPRASLMRTGTEPFLLRLPCIVKPSREDGSAGISSASVVHDEAALRRRVAHVSATFRQSCLVEEYVDGRELNVALFGHPTARVLPLQEIDFSALPPGLPRIVTYEAKWNLGSVEDLGTRPVLLPDLPDATSARVRRVAQAAFRAIGLRDYGRVDVRLDREGVPYVVDVNPNCDLSPDAGMARAAAAMGVDYPSLVRLLVRYATKRRVRSALRARG